MTASPAWSALSSLETRVKLRGCTSVGRGARVVGEVWVHGGGSVVVGDRVVFDGRDAPIELYAWPGASLVIGADTYVCGGTSFEATRRISVGARARIGEFCSVMDNHFHAMVGDRSVMPAPNPVEIGDDVVLGARVIVLAGARIPRGATVNAGSVVKRTGPAPGRDAPPVPGDRRDESGTSPRQLMAELLRLSRLLVTHPAAGAARVNRVLGVARARVLFRGCECGELVNAMGYVRVVADGHIKLGDRVQLSHGMLPTELLCHTGAELFVGARTLFSYGVSVDATTGVYIGERCLFGSGARVRDVGPEGPRRVVIGDDVWVAHGATVEAGVTIGDRSVVAAGTVVRADVPPDSLASGNPAVITRLR